MLVEINNNYYNSSENILNNKNFSSNLCPEYFQIHWLDIILQQISIIINLACGFVLLFFIPGIIGISLSLLTLYAQRNNKQYENVKPYYFPIFLMDLIIIIVFGVNGLTTYFLYSLLKHRVFWNDQSISKYLCKLTEYSV